jgi:hypothetical protein
MKPSVGRIVHLVSRAGKCLAAIVTDVDPVTPPVGNEAGFYIDQVAVTAFPGAVDVSPVGFDGAQRPHPGTWHWPERAE